MHDAQNLKRADYAVAGCGKIAENNMPALFAAEIEILRNHFFNHVAVADLGPDDLAAIGGQRFVETKVAHDRRDEGVVAELVRLQEIKRGNRQNLIAVNDLTVFVAKQNAIGITVVRNPNIGVGGCDEPLDFVRMHAAAAIVNIHSVWLVVGDLHVGAELTQNAGRGLVRGTVRDIYRDAQLLERHFSRETRLSEFNVASQCVIDTGGTSNFPCGWPNVVDFTRENEVLDLRFNLVIEFVAVMSEKFDTVVFVRIVGSREHDAGIGAQRARDVSDARRWQRPDDKNVDTERRDPGDKRILEHVTGKSRIL